MNWGKSILFITVDLGAARYAAISVILSYTSRSASTDLTYG